MLLSYSILDKLFNCSENISMLSEKKIDMVCSRGGNTKKSYSN